MNIANMLERHAADRPEHVAIEQGDEKLNYEQLCHQVRTVARHLQETGVKKGDVVGVMLPSCPAYIVAMFALAKLGAVILGIDESIPAAEREKGIDGFDIKAVIAHPGTTVIIPGARVIDINGIPAAPEERLNPAADSTFDATSPLIVVQSSGTTGKPKSVILSHESVRTRILKHERSVGVDESDRLYLILDMAYSGARRRSMATIYIGGTVVLTSVRSMTEGIREIADKHITWLAVTPARLTEFLTHANGSTPMFRSLKMMTVTSSRVAPDVRSRARELLCPNLVERYATNEVGLLAIASPTDQVAYPDSVGKIIDDVEAQIVDEDLRPVSPGEVGQARFRAPYFPKAYLNDPNATAKAFRDGWFYPGDLASINEEGYLFLKGRDDDVLNIGGEKFFPVEVENVLVEHTDVVEAVVLGRQIDDDEPVAVAFVVVTTDVTYVELVEYCSSRLAVYKVPRRFEVVTEIPKNPQGKILRRELKVLYQERHKLTREEANWSGDTL